MSTNKDYFQATSFLEGFQGRFCRTPILLWLAIIVMNLRISVYIRYPVAAMIILFFVVAQFERNYVFTKESVEMYSCFHEDKIEPNPTIELLMKISPPRPVRRIRCKSISREALKRVTMYSTWYGAMLVVELQGCQPRYEESMWQYILHNRKNVLVIRAELPYAYNCYDLIEEYIAGTLEFDEEWGQTNY